MTASLEFLIENLPNLLFGFPGHRPGGLIMSCLLAVVAVAGGFALASLLGQGLNSTRSPIRWVSRTYVWVIRGVPLILLLLLVHQLTGWLRPIGISRAPLASALIALILHSSAYQASILQAGMRAMPSRLADLAKLHGHTNSSLVRLRLRYAWHVMRPALTGQAISLFKDTSVVIVLGVVELMTVANLVLGSDLNNTQHWLALYAWVGLCYFGIAFAASLLIQRLDRPDRSGDLIFSFSTQ